MGLFIHPLYSDDDLITYSQEIKLSVEKVFRMICEMNTNKILEKVEHEFNSQKNL